MRGISIAPPKSLRGPREGGPKCNETNGLNEKGMYGGALFDRFVAALGHFCPLPSQVIYFNYLFIKTIRGFRVAICGAAAPHT